MSNQIIASYLRISIEDNANSGESENGSENGIESESITGQRALIADYIRTNEDLRNAKHFEFCDDGYSGTNFNRPAVQELINKAKCGEIDCIIVKDFSRFGRNYIEVSDYLEQIFPFLKVRFISVNDNYDSAANKYPAVNMDIAFKNLYNDYYSKDISRKVKSSLNILRESGKYLSNYAIFGYAKSKEDKHKLVIDEEAAIVVRRIFDMAVSGKSTSEIARTLNADGILTPSAYKKSKNIYAGGRKTLAENDNNMWTGDAVAYIIKDIRYTGAVVQGMYEKHFVGSSKSRRLPRDEWTVCHNRHEPVVTKEKYEEAAKNCLKKQGAVKNTGDRAEFKSPLSQTKIRCGCCGYALNRPKHKNGIELYCKKKNSTGSNCFRGSISIKTVERAALVSVQKLLSAYLSDSMENANVNETENVDGGESNDKKEKSSSTVDLFAEISKIRKEIARTNDAKLNIYKSYSDGDITREQYLKEREAANTQIERLSLQVSILENEYERKQKNSIPPNSVTEFFSEFSSFSSDKQTIEYLTPEIVAALIDCVYVYDVNRIEIKWSFKDPHTGKKN